MIIGIDLKRDEITHALDACLLTDTEMALGTRKWCKLDDPFMDWLLDPHTDH